MAAMLALFFASLLTITSASCLHGIQARDLHSLEARAENANFGYTGVRGPLKWDELNPDYQICATGTNQSPININAGSTHGVRTLGPGSRPTINYPSISNAEFRNLGDTVQVTMGQGTMRLDGVDYTPQQFHFHVPSEHRLNEEFYPIEVHFVHQRTNPLPDGSRPLAVIGYFFQIGSGGGMAKLFDEVFKVVNNIRSSGSTTTIGSLEFGALKTLLENSESYQYSGSLTTPPCSQGVNWVVVKDALPVAADFFNAIKSVIKFNSRYTQNNPGQPNLLA